MQFKLDPAGFEPIRKRIAAVTWLIGGIAAIAGAGIPIFSKSIPFVASAFATLIAVLMIWLAIKNAIKQREKGWHRYQLTIAENKISAEQDIIPTVSIGFENIAEITEDQHGTLNIKQKNSNQIIHVPSAIENREQLLSKLSHLNEITEIKSSGIAALVFPTIILLAGFFWFFTSSAQAVVLTLGPILVFSLAWSLLAVHRSLVEKKIKLLSYFVLLPILSIAGRILLFLEVFK